MKDNQRPWPIPTIPLSELIPELRKIEDGGGSLREYIEELEEKSKNRKSQQRKNLIGYRKIRSLARHDNQTIP